jgi:hypothetical protein
MRNRPVKEYERAAIRIIYKDGDIVDTDTSHGAEQIIREDFPTAHISPWIRGKITVQDEGKTIAHFYPLKADGTIAKYSSSLEATQRLRNPVGPRRLPASRPSRNARFGRIPERKISIPDGTKIVALAPATKDDLKPGAGVSVQGVSSGENMVAADRLSVGLDGTTPP